MSISPVLGLQTCTPMLCFYVGSWDWNLGLCACITSTLLDSSPQNLNKVLYIKIKLAPDLAHFQRDSSCFWFICSTFFYTQSFTFCSHPLPLHHCFFLLSLPSSMFPPLALGKILGSLVSKTQSLSLLCLFVSMFTIYLTSPHLKSKFNKKSDCFLFWSILKALSWQN